MEIDHFQPMLKESIDRFLIDYRHGATDFSNISFIFSRLLQNLPDPSLDYVWFHSALSFYATKFTLLPSSSNHLIYSATKDLFHLLVSSSASCSLVKRVSVLCPLLYQLYHLAFDDDLKRDFDCLLDGIVSYICICCGGQQQDDGIVGLNLSPSFVDLVHVWVVDRVDKNSDSGDELTLFLPLVSDRVRDGVGVGCRLDYLAGVVMCEAFLLRLCSKFGLSMFKDDLEKQLHDCTLQMLSGFRSFYFFDILLEMLLEPVLPVTSKLRLASIQGSEDESLLQEVLHDAVVTADYSFLTHQRGFHLPCKSLKNLAVRWILVVHNALQSAREIGDHAKVLSYINAFSKSCLPSLLIKWVTNQTALEERTSRPIVSTPLSLIKWLLIVEDKGIRVFDCEISKTYAKTILGKSGVEYNLQVIMTNDNNLNGNIVFYNDDEGRGGDKVDSDLEMVDSGDNDFLAVPFLMKSTMSNITRKRKEGADIEGEIPVKFVKYHLRDTSMNDSFLPLCNDDGLSSGSEVDNPASDGDMEDMKQ